MGRGKEWEQLLACWRRAAQGDTCMALVLGEPGIGKSRLADELYHWRSQKKDGAAARARCYIAQGQLAYAPAAEWLRSDALRQARTRLSKPQLAELARVLPEILCGNPDLPPPQPLTESWQRRHFYEALNALFHNAPKPLLLLIDDLQWCDRDSFEWLHSLFQSVSAGHILILGTARPEETGRDHPLTRLAMELKRDGRVAEIPLEPLNSEDTAALAIEVGQREFDPAFPSDLYQATKGNPLFVVESVRAGLEGRRSGRAAPPRVHAVIAARLAQLSAPAYELAGLAATIGRSFSFDLLAKATDWDESSLSSALEELWQRRIIDGHGADSYDFTHDLLREVTYAELSPVRRRFLHRRAGRALEELHAGGLENVSGRLAAHYDAAGMHEQAIRQYQAAAAVARRRYAETEAVGLLRRALELCRDFPEASRRDERELELLVALGPSLIIVQGYAMPEVGETYARALELLERTGDDRHALASGAQRRLAVPYGSRRTGEIAGSSPAMSRIRRWKGTRPQA